MALPPAAAFLVLPPPVPGWRADLTGGEAVLPDPLGIAAPAFLLVVLMAGLVWWTAARRSRTDAKRARPGEEPRSAPDASRDLFELMPDGIVVVDSGGTILRVNAQAEAMFGYGRAELEGSPVEVLLPERLRDGHPLHRGDYMRDPSTRPMGVRAEVLGRRKDGSEFPAGVTLGQARIEGRTVVISAVRDVTERKVAEEALRREVALVTMLGDAAAEANRAATVAEAVPSILGGVCGSSPWPIGHIYLVERDGGGEAVPSNVWHLPDPGRFDPLRKATAELRFAPGVGLVGRVLAGGKPMWVADPADELVGARQAAARALGVRSWAGFPILAGREVAGVLEFFSLDPGKPDPRLFEVVGHVASLLGRVFERQKAAEALARSAAELGRSNKDLEDFALIASHDLQEPLRKVVAFGGLLGERAGAALDARSRDYLARMDAGARRMQALLQGLLELSRVTTSARDFERTDLDSVVREVVADLEVLLRESGGRVEAGHLPALPADRVQMRQLLQNLVANALKFRQPGRTPVVTIRAEPASGGRWRLEVADNGIGFDEKYLDRLFKPFERLHGREAYAGTGMGLSICRKIVARHGGEITARSTPGAGSRFLVTLPGRPGTGGGPE